MIALSSLRNWHGCRQEYHDMSSIAQNTRALWEIESGKDCALYVGGGAKHKQPESAKINTDVRGYLEVTLVDNRYSTFLVQGKHYDVWSLSNNIDKDTNTRRENLNQGLKGARLYISRDCCTLLSYYRTFNHSIPFPFIPQIYTSYLAISLPYDV
jgi:hypothetical protein